MTYKLSIIIAGVFLLWMLVSSFFNYQLQVNVSLIGFLLFMDISLVETLLPEVRKK